MTSFYLLSLKIGDYKAKEVAGKSLFGCNLKKILQKTYQTKPYIRRHNARRLSG
ncbi:hypothetical protein [Helicobacter pullorum]|uniref:hypothetical protein n=1 Tax=Helicobacter pullorum TaxID=35818 RepID=UPI00147879E5|nr:hypothetical protein [Helicobacter pullorum]